MATTVKATTHLCPVVLFITLYKVDIALEFVGEKWKCDNSNESYWAGLSCCVTCYTVQGVSNFKSKFWNVGTKYKFLSSTSGH